MHNPFQATPTDSPEVEAEAAEMFGALGAEGLSEGASSSIRASMLAALAASGRAVGSRRGIALAGSALVAPLVLVGAASAATGESPLEAPGSVLEVAASSVGIGGNSGEVRQDIDVRNEAAGDNGQPGSQPGNTANAPGLNGGAGGEDTGDDGEGDDDDVAPDAGGVAGRRRRRWGGRGRPGRHFSGSG
jgi:hypothetical protein